RTVERSQAGIKGGRGGFSLLAPLRKRTTRSFLPSDWPATGAWKVAMATTYTLSVKGV
ncbi:hypothetical protein PO909_008503, partial [Leuciscus waleckii]